jgi:hypothetical protein
LAQIPPVFQLDELTGVKYASRILDNFQEDIIKRRLSDKIFDERPATNKPWAYSRSI